MADGIILSIILLVSSYFTIKYVQSKDQSLGDFLNDFINRLFPSPDQRTEVSRDDNDELKKTEDAEKRDRSVSRGRRLNRSGSPNDSGFSSADSLIGDDDDISLIKKAQENRGQSSSSSSNHKTCSSHVVSSNEQKQKGGIKQEAERDEFGG